MGRIILFTGGGRSGKSSFAQQFAGSLPGPRLFLATAVPFDGELKERIARHQESRHDLTWSTIDVPVSLAGAIREAHNFPVILVDCLTMWVNNLMWAAGHEPPEQTEAITEDDVAAACAEVISSCQEHAGTIVFITNEVGLGIIPDNVTARLYRDLLGRCNQVIASAADAVVLMVSGLPLPLKGGDSLALPGLVISSSSRKE